jgi:hypothetical protein
MAVEPTQINLADLLAARTYERQPRIASGDRGANPQVKPKLAALRASAIPDANNAPSVARGDFRDGIAGSLLDPIEAALVGAHAPIMRGCGHRSSCHYPRSALPTFADYAVGMPKARSRKPIAHDGDQRNKTAGDARNEIALTTESALPPKKPPPAPSVTHRLRR